jgi:hypothetical protein
MLRVCSSRGITATSILWREKREESRQVALYSEPRALRAIIEPVTTSALCHTIMIAARIEYCPTYNVHSAHIPSPRTLGKCNSIWQLGGAK